MKAAVYTRYGPPEVLQIKEIDKPVPAAREVLIKVCAATVTPGDYRMRGFIVPKSFALLARIAWGFKAPRKQVLGVEIAGVVEQVGKSVTKFKAGDKVFSLAMEVMGGYAEYACRPEKGAIAKIPGNLTCEESATIAFGGLSALYFLRSAGIKTRQKILIYGASGSVGTAAVQLAKYYGAKVTSVCSTGNLEMVKSLGSDDVIDYTKEDFTQRGEVYDIIFDTVSKLQFTKIKGSLKKGGYYLDTVLPFSGIVSMYRLITSGRRVIGGTGKEEVKDMEFLRELVEAGKFKPVIDKTYTFDEIVEAHRYAEKGHKKGNLLIRITD